MRVPRRAEDVVANGTLPPGTRSVVDGRNDVEPVEVVDTSDGDGDFRTVVVGPVPVARVDLVSAIETRVHEWMLLHNNRHTRRVVLMAGGPTAPLTLWANNKRLPPGEPMVRASTRARARDPVCARASAACAPSCSRLSLASLRSVQLARKGNPLEGLGGLELRPRGIEWDTSVPEEPEGQ